MGAPKKYTKRRLSEAVENYFKSISREITLTEKKPTGKKDKMGHEIYENVPVKNALGQEMTVTEYLIPPCVLDLSAFLGIHRSTWENYCDHKRYPEFFDTTERAMGRIHAYLVRESLTRQGKDLKGVLFNLENNFGYKERMELTNDTVESFLQRQLEAEGSGEIGL